jgi:hypothetical protein
MGGEIAKSRYQGDRVRKKQPAQDITFLTKQAFRPIDMPSILQEIS